MEFFRVHFLGTNADFLAREGMHWVALEEQWGLEVSCNEPKKQSSSKHQANLDLQL